jgi:NhaA family Na+:H+ antiporter
MRQKIKKLNPTNIFGFLLKEERRSSTLLILVAALALFVANSAWSKDYVDFFHRTFELAGVNFDIRHWINEALMALFFLVVSLEVKRELIDGELRSWRKASFPLFAAAGGMLVPALIFSVFNPLPPSSNGWAIPMATDIAIAVGVLTLLGKRVHKSLRIFLLSLAIIDDIGSIIIIGLFYQKPTNILALLIAIVLVLVLAIVRKSKIWPLYFLIGGPLIGYCLLLAGISGTLAGVVIAALMPLRRKGKKVVNLQASEIVEDLLIPVTTFAVVPLFVFANAGLSLSNISLSSEHGLPVFGGILLGLFVGKPIGIVLASWIAHKLALTHKPVNLSWTHIGGIGMLAGIGFTVSLLVTDLSYKGHTALQTSATLGIFTASILAGFTGLIFLSRTLPKRS